MTVIIGTQLTAIHDQFMTEARSMVTATEGGVQGRQQDAFQRHVFADRLAQVLSVRTGHESFVIGLQGPWGSGKTSLLNLVRESLTTLERAVVVPFNPWLYPSDEALLRSLIEALAHGIDANLVRRAERIGDALRTLSDVLLGFARAGSAVNEALKPGVEAADQGVKAGLSLLPTSSSGLEELKRRINAALRDGAIPVVVLIDDLDRLSSRQIQQLFRLIKLALDFDNVTFVLTYDPDHVARALGGEYGLGEEDGHQYLEKIVQLPLQLPKLDPPTFAEYVLELLSQAVQDSGVELGASDRGRFQVTFERLMLPRLTTPRQAKRLANSIRFTLPLVAGDTNPGDVMLVEAMRLLYPRTYRVLRESPDEVLRPSQRSP
ncbi:KAP family P-loop NTPase fold protein [Deinococcus sp. UYEF24]